MWPIGTQTTLRIPMATSGGDTGWSPRSLSSITSGVRARSTASGKDPAKLTRCPVSRPLDSSRTRNSVPPGSSSEMPTPSVVRASDTRAAASSMSEARSTPPVIASLPSCATADCWRNRSVRRSSAGVTIS